MNPDKPIALLHVYGLHERKPDKSNTRGGGQLRAAEMLYEKGEIGGVVITGGKIYSGRSGLAGIMAGEIQRRGVIPPESINVYPSPEGGARSTIAEIDLFKEIVERNGWDNLADIANQAHIEEIRAELKHAFGQKAERIPIFNAEQVLIRNNPRFAPVIRRGQVSQDEFAFQWQQDIKMKIRKVPFVREGQAFFAKILPNKATIQESVLRIIKKSKWI